MQKIPRFLNRAQLFLIFEVEEFLLFLMLGMIFIVIQDISVSGAIIDSVIFLGFMRKNRQMKRLYGKSYMHVAKRRSFPFWAIGDKAFPAFHMREFIG